MASLLVKKSEDDDGSMSDKEKAGIAWRILQFCLASRIQKVKVPQDTHILQEPPGPDKAKSLQEQFVSKMAAAADMTTTTTTEANEKINDVEDEARVEEEVTEVKAMTTEEAATPTKVSSAITATTPSAAATETPTNTIVDDDRKPAPKQQQPRKASKSASQSRSRTPSVSLDKPAGGGGKGKKKGKANKKGGGDDEENLDALIAEVMKMDATKAETEVARGGSGSSSKRSSSSR